MIFLDSSVNTHHDRTKINVPPHPFSAVGTERIALSLQQFSIRRNWLNINPTNKPTKEIAMIRVCVLLDWFVTY